MNGIACIACLIGASLFTGCGSDQEPADQSLPSINVAVLDPTAREPVGGNINNGSFLIRRSGNLDEDLQVFFEMGGSATNEIDYKKIGRSVKLTPGMDSHKISVGPIADTQNEGTETVRITILANDNYSIGSFSSVQLAIQDESPE